MAKATKVKVVKEYEGHWMVFSQRTYASIVAFDDWFMGKNKRRYRVDMNGRTEASMIDTFAQAKAIATRLVK